jgi:hypothetical protein
MVEQILQFTRIRDKPFEVFGLQDALNDILPGSLEARAILFKVGGYFDGAQVAVL